MKYYILTLGCQMNKSDSERIGTALEGLGYKKTDKETKADLIVVVSCSVRQSAIDRIYGFVRKFQNFQRSDLGWRLRRRSDLKKPILILTGCVLDQDKEKLSDKFDLIFDINELQKLKEFLQEIPNDKISPSCSARLRSSRVEDPKGRAGGQMTKSPPEAGGQNLKSKNVILGSEATPESPLRQGFEGQADSGQAGMTDGTKSDFVKLLEKINAIPGDPSAGSGQGFWIRFVTSHPKDMGEDLIWAIANLGKVTEYIHLPVQSGDDEILKKMNRHYTAEQYLDLLVRILANAHISKGVVPTITTDIIVGFPGETKAQFENTKKLMKEAKFDMAYIAEYSPRPGTAAAKLKDNIPKSEKQRRKKELDEILRKTALHNNKKYLGKKVEVLLEYEKNGIWFGKTRGFKVVKVINCKRQMVNGEDSGRGQNDIGVAPRLRSKTNISANEKAPTLGSGRVIWVKITKVSDFGLQGVFYR